MDSIKISPMKDISAAQKDAAGYAHNVIRQISDVFVDAAADKIDWDEVQEAWFFDQHTELHFFRTDDELMCVKAEEKENPSHVVTHTYEIANAAKGGREDKSVLEVREYLDFDEDGQCYVAYTRLADIRSGSRK